ncbi:glutathione peroxidase [soil metagenome]
MISKLLGGLIAIGLLSTLVAADSPTTRPTSVLDFTVNDIHGTPVALSKYQGKVLLIVNTASKCGFTPQYDALEKLNEKYGAEGLAVLGFPCNDFGHQDPGTNEEILTFCTSKFNVKFDMFSKVVVKGNEKTPLYEFLISKDTDPKFGGAIGWNFTKFLIGRDGQIAGRFDSKVKPDSELLTKALEAELAKK